MKLELEPTEELLTLSCYHVIGKLESSWKGVPKGASECMFQVPVVQCEVHSVYSTNNFLIILSSDTICLNKLDMFRQKCSSETTLMKTERFHRNISSMFKYILFLVAKELRSY